MHRAWGSYPDTVLTFPDVDLVIDLRRPLSPAIRRRLAELGLGRPFAVITACNPLGTRLEERANRRLCAVLERQVSARYPGARPAQGGSPDGTHREPGWALPISLEEAKRLAGGFLQNAVFWYDGEKFQVVPVHAPFEALTLPERGER
ncbi:MAG: DUF3293 domain-containing protein [Gemmatimonadales bacterium]